MSTAENLDQLCVNTIRTLSMDAVQAANSGHPGMPMGMADVAYVLWSKFLNIIQKIPSWFDRDRFILSAGHGSMLLYSLATSDRDMIYLLKRSRISPNGQYNPGTP